MGTCSRALATHTHEPNFPWATPCVQIQNSTNNLVLRTRRVVYDQRNLKLFALLVTIGMYFTHIYIWTLTLLSLSLVDSIGRAVICIVCSASDLGIQLKVVPVATSLTARVTSIPVSHVARQFFGRRAVTQGKTLFDRRETCTGVLHILWISRTARTAQTTSIRRCGENKRRLGKYRPRHRGGGSAEKGACHTVGISVENGHEHTNRRARRESNNSRTVEGRVETSGRVSSPILVARRPPPPIDRRIVLFANLLSAASLHSEESP